MQYQSDPDERLRDVLISSHFCRGDDQPSLKPEDLQAAPSIPETAQVRSFNGLEIDEEGGVLHDIKNLLFALRAGIYQIQDAHENLPFATQEVLEGMDETISLLSLLFQNGMAPETMDQERKQQRVELHHFLKRFLKVSRVFFRQLNPEFRVLVDGNSCPLLEVMVDRYGLQVILLNLLHNASRYVPQYGAEILVFAEKTHMQIGNVSTVPALRLVVRDNGTGIDPEALPTIFDRGVSLQGPGSGLGLSIVRDMVWEMGGDIRVVSQHHDAFPQDSFTQFEVILPVAFPRGFQQQDGVFSREEVVNLLLDETCEEDPLTA